MKITLMIFVSLALIFLSFYASKTNDVFREAGNMEMQIIPEHLRMDNCMKALYPRPPNQPIIIPGVLPPFIGSSFIGFKESLAFKESRGNYFSVNTLGYMGKYQFGMGTLQLVGIYDAGAFLTDPALQEAAFRSNVSRNKWILRNDIVRYSGKKIKGILITESGILAAAHLSGPGNVKRFLRSNGMYNVSDVFGSYLSDYLKRFSGYDTSGIPAIRNPKV
ncbi:MAG: hypothetical protein OER83_01035 [Flavobacteriaceae bacterium]|nr:hypothetical protein [Flavobacteriaceae bacterium]MDH3795435.1 hypothetical protein [Flavobacteriaceae bacterium]